MSDIQGQLLSALVQYGFPVLFGAVLVAAVGVPLPVSLLLVAAGSFVEQGEFSYWWIIAVTVLAAVVGDNIGYGLGRWGGRPVVERVAGWVGGTAQLIKAEQLANRWGATGIFFSRWLVSPVGPAINLTSGIAAFPWLLFVMLDIAGELVWVMLYVTLGRMFSDRVQAISDLLGNLTWVIVGGCLIIFLAWKVVKMFWVGPETVPITQR